ncbi:hypothetical protein Tco_0441403 [Tanacetum coccineum]
MLAICSANEPVAFQAPKTTRQADKMKPEGTKPGAKTGRRKKSNPLTMNNALSKPKATKSTNPNVLVDKTQFARDGLGTVQTDVGTEKATSVEQEFDTSVEITQSCDEVDQEIKLEDLLDLVKYIGTKAMDLNTQEDDQPFMVLSDEEESHVEPHAKTDDTSVPASPSPKSIKIQELSTKVILLQSQNIKLEKEKAAVEAAFLSSQPSCPNVQQLTELLVKSLKPELSQILTDHDFITSIPTELKKLPSKVNDLYEAVGDIKKYVEDLEIEVPRDLKVLPKKLEEFYPPKTTPQPEGEQVKDKGKTSLSYEEVVEEESESDSDVEISLSAKSEIKKGKQDLIDLLGLDVVEKMYKDKVYMDDNSDEIIQNFKASDLHLGKWKEVIEACPKRNGAGSTTIYTQIRQRFDALHITEAELELDISKPLDGQDHIIKLNFLAKKKRKNVDDLHDYFKSTKSAIMGIGSYLEISLEVRSAAAMSVVYVLITPILKDGENAIVDQIRRRNKWNNNDYVCRYLIFKVSPSWKDSKHTLKHKKKELTLVELGSHLRIEESLKVQDSDKPKDNNVVGPQGLDMVV